MSEIQPPAKSEPLPGAAAAGSSSPSSNVRIYDRPERKGPSPLVLGIALIVMLVVGFLLVKAFYHPASPAVKPQVGWVTLSQTPFGFAPQGVSLFPRR